MAIDLKDFFLKDYELKARYLSDHFQRMWTRFNFFVTIESALISGKFLIESGKPTPRLAIVGMLLSLGWYVFGAQDRFLVLVYRKQAQDAAESIYHLIQPDLGTSKTYCPLGEVDKSAQAFRNTVSGWRWEPISITRLAALFPLIVLGLWLIMLIVELPPS